MTTLVVDACDKKLYQELEVVYEDGSIRSLRTLARSSIRVDLDTLYRDGRPTMPPPPAE